MHERRTCVGELGLIFGELPFSPYYGFDIGVLRSVIAWRPWRISWVYGILSYIFSLLFLVLLSKLVHSFALVSSSASAFACMVRRRLLSTIIIDLIAWAAFFFLGEVRVYR